MQNPMNWAFPLFRLFGVTVRLHILYIVVTLSFILKLYLDKDNFVSLLDIVLVMVPLLFFSVLLHEFGHIFGGRSVGGEGDDILMWPLGGLASVDVPRDWRSHTTMILAGPGVNLAICCASAFLLMANGLVPTLNPISNPFVLPMTSLKDGRTYTSEYELRLYRPGTSETVGPIGYGKPEVLDSIATTDATERALAPRWLTWINRIFWMNWVLLLFNMLIPAYPMDAAQVLQGLVWARTDFNTGLRVACFSGYLFGTLMLVAAFVFNQTLLLGLSLFCLFESWRRLRAMEAEMGEFGYDFSGGYSTMGDGDETKAKKPKSLSFFKRWRQAVAMKRLKREHEQRTQDDERMDQLLEKINAKGKDSLTAEERRFMQRVSERYRKQ